jgi:hypothetical protein
LVFVEGAAADAIEDGCSGDEMRHRSTLLGGLLWLDGCDEIPADVLEGGGGDSDWTVAHFQKVFGSETRTFSLRRTARRQRRSI